MKPQTVLILFALSGFVATVTSQGFGEVYCGRRLSTVLALLCDNNLIKRSQPQFPSAQGVDVNWPWIAMHRARSMGRSKRQVVAECCDKPCTINELMSYCGN